MDKVDETVHDVNNHYYLTTSLATSLSYHQLILHIRSVLANLWNSLSYIRTVSMHTMDYGWCHYNWDTFTSCLTHHRPSENIVTHRGNLTTYIASTSIIGGYTTLLLIPIDPHSDHQQTILTPYRCTYSGLITTILNLQNFYLGHPSWTFHSLLWHQHPIPWYHSGWNNGSRNLTSSIQHLSGSQ